MAYKLLAATGDRGLTEGEIRHTLSNSLAAYAGAKRILLVPPDISRSNAYAGPVVRHLRELFLGAEISLLPAIGTHTPMTPAEIQAMYGDFPLASVITHDWRHGTVKLGEVEGEYLAGLSGGLLTDPIAVDISEALLRREFDLVVSIGQVVPHEVAGFANYTKNILVGCGGLGMINGSHYLGAMHGMERLMGRANNPVRQLYNHAAARFLQHLPIVYVLTVTTPTAEGIRVEGLGVGTGDELFFAAADLSRDKNITVLPEPIHKAVVYLDPAKFRTTWVGNKAIYRMRMALADGAELLIVAPGLSGCGEDAHNDFLIRRYGYRPTVEVVDAVRQDRDLAENLAVAAHLIHGSSDGRFKVTYAPGHMTADEIRSLGYEFMELDAALKHYPVNRFQDGFNDINGERIFFVRNPALGLWTTREKFAARGERSGVTC